MAEVKIFWTETAKKQRNQIFSYWNKRNGNLLYSQKLKQSIKERVQLLKKNPDLGKSTNFKSTQILVMGTLQSNLPVIFFSNYYHRFLGHSQRFRTTSQFLEKKLITPLHPKQFRSNPIA